MIELISDARCVQCNLCVSVCPTNVFDKVDNDVPVIARQNDCQTCFMCELYCPADAMYVAPHPDRLIGLSEPELEQAELLGATARRWDGDRAERPYPAMRFWLSSRSVRFLNRQSAFSGSSTLPVCMGSMICGLIEARVCRGFHEAP